METYINIINNYGSNQLQTYLQNKSLSVLKNIENHLRESYHKGNELVDDFKYDILVDIIKDKEPTFVPPIGEIVDNIERVSLPYWLGSMDKIKPENISKINNWVSRYGSDEYIIESKLDGISCLLFMNNNVLSLYTRGDGSVGSDISHLAKYIKNIPKKRIGNIAVRGELIMKVDVFNLKYGAEYKNPRNLVAGLTNKKTVSNIIKDVDFIAYEIVNFDNNEAVNEIENPSFQLKHLKKLGFTIVNYDIIDEISSEILVEKLVEFKQDSPYEIDGIIVQADVKYTRNTSGNPDYAFAFKILSEVAETTVINVEWNISKWGALKPRVEIEPVELAGVLITYATGFNAKFIKDNEIGPGSRILITRSGDVIPYILKILTRTEADMPTIEYVWNETGVDIISENPDEMCIKRMLSFFSQLDIKFLGAKTIEKIFKSGFDNILKIIGATKEELYTVEGFGKKTVDRIHDNMHSKLTNISLVSVLGASGIFGQGIGTRKLKPLFNEIPDILELHKNISREEMLSRIINVQGFSDKTALKIISGLSSAEQFRDRLMERGVTFSGNVVANANIQTTSPLSGTKIVFSGFRDKDLSKIIVDNGGQTTDSVSKNTTCVVVKIKGENTGKEAKAISLGIPVYTKEEFVNMYIH